MAQLAWSLQVLSAGIRPTQRHDTRDDCDDPQLGEIIGDLGPNLGFTAICLWLKGDWAEASHTLALANVMQKYQPCPFCCVDKAGLHTHYRNADMPLRTADYWALCSEREISILVDTEAGQDQNVLAGCFALMLACLTVFREPLAGEAQVDQRQSARCYGQAWPWYGAEQEDQDRRGNAGGSRPPRAFR